MRILRNEKKKNESIDNLEVAFAKFLDERPEIVPRFLLRLAALGALSKGTDRETFAQEAARVFGEVESTELWISEAHDEGKEVMVSLLLKRSTLSVKASSRVKKNKKNTDIDSVPI